MFTHICGSLIENSFIVSYIGMLGSLVELFEKN